MNVLEIITLVIWILALVADFVVCLLKHRNNKVDLTFYKSSMLFVGFVNAICSVIALYANDIGSIGMYIIVALGMFVLGVFYHWFQWCVFQTYCKRQS